MFLSPQCHRTCCYTWRSLLKGFLNISVSLDNGLFTSCLIPDSAHYFLLCYHCYQLMKKKCTTSDHKRLPSVVIMESESHNIHHKSSPRRKCVEVSHQLPLTQDLQENVAEDVNQIYLPPSLQCKGISEKSCVKITNQMLLQEADKESAEERSVKCLPPSLQYKSVSEDGFGINKKLLPLQEMIDVCDFKTTDFHASFNSSCSCNSGKECKDTSNQQPSLDRKKTVADKTKLQLPPSLLHFVERFVRDNIKLVTDQVKKESYEDMHKGEFSEGCPYQEFEDTETPFSNMNLFSPSESTECWTIVKEKKSRKRLNKLSKKKIAKSWKDSRSLSVQSENDQTPQGKGKKKQPNYFIAIQVNNTEITRAAMKIQSSIQEASGQDLSQLQIAPETFHITLMVMHLSNQEEIDKASHCLTGCIPAIKKSQTDLPLTLEFEGLSGFSGGRVIFACVNGPGQEMLQFMSDEVKNQMKDCGVENTDPENKPFRPHLTLMKYRWKPKSNSTKGPKKVEDSWYQAFASEYLGSQKINSLQLCRMHEKRDDGYYFVAQEVPF